MADVVLNSAVRSNLRTLQSTTELLNQTEERLATGKKVNSAFDNPASYFTSQALDRRANDLNSLLDSVSASVQTLKAADNGVKAITDVVESLKATARAALQSPLAVDEKAAIESADLGDGATAKNLLGGTALAAADTLIVRDADGATVTVTFGTGAGQVDSLDELNAYFESKNVLLDASFDGATRKLKIEADNSIANSTPVTATGTATGAGNAFVSGAFSAPVLDPDASQKRANFAADYNAALKEINTLAKDANYNGVNLLMGDDLDVVFNEDGSSKLEVKGVQFDANGIGLQVIGETDFYDSSSINAVLDRIEASFKVIEAQAAKFGSQLQIVQTRETFTKDMIGTLEDGAHALTAADTNEEAANLATLQTRQSLIVTSLSISTQQESAILQLLR
jgi:flagellin-like hook-associated protein FlgL